MDIDKVMEQAEQAREAMGPVEVNPSAGTESSSNSGEDYKALYEARTAELRSLEYQFDNWSTQDARKAAADKYDLPSGALDLITEFDEGKIEEQARSLAALTAPTPALASPAKLAPTGGWEPAPRIGNLSGLLTGERKPTNPRGALRNA
ncbi:hypothetical protein ACODT5_09610 [Streptomyces sp. 5.8]|uniref:hypothetical protein n=1 Tax=Streptomyces sp. 5.8 TaxID=3406571 RepID=UPI003BB73833